ncbi:magnesium transporter CorA family protein [Lacticaseibacillus thailandensis]|nr:magnesium transporter CorA family protein [Lacticaseibacillus thailandensis]
MRQPRPLGTAPAAVERPARWLHIDDLNRTQANALAQRYDVPTTWLVDVTNSHADPRVEDLANKEDGQALILIRAPYQTTTANGITAYETMPVAFILHDDLLITACAAPLPILTEWERLAEVHGTVTTFAAAAIHAVCDAFTATADTVDDTTRKMEKRVTSSSHNDLLLEIMAMEKSLVYLSAALGHMQSVMAELRKVDYLFTTDSTAGELLYRANIELNEGLTLVESTEQILEQYNAAISAIVGNNLNLIMKMLTSVSILLAIPPIISGIWGQNTWIPWQHGASGFWIVFAISAALTGMVAWWLKRRKYF